MDIRHLEYFVAVAEEGHFTRAAKRLHLAQSGLSATIRALERELGTSLFIRSTRQVALTEAGRILLGEARKALAAVEHARDAVAAVEGLLQGRLRIGTSQLAHSVTREGELTTLLGRFHRRYPAVELQFQEGLSVQLLDGVRAGRLDIAFIGLVGEPPPDLSVTPLVDELLVLVCAPEHPLAARTAVSFADFAAEPFIDFPPQGVLRHYVDRGFAAAQRERRRGIEVETMSAALQLVAEGLGVSVVPRRLAVTNPAVRQVALLPEVAVRFVAVTADDPPASAAARALLALVAPTPR